MQIPKTYKGILQLFVDLCDHDPVFVKGKNHKNPSHKPGDRFDISKDAYDLIKSLVADIQNTLGDNDEILHQYNLKENYWYKNESNQ